jgi:hypothetical protein
MTLQKFVFSVTAGLLAVSAAGYGVASVLGDVSDQIKRPQLIAAQLKTMR